MTARMDGWVKGSCLAAALAWSCTGSIEDSNVQRPGFGPGADGQAGPGATGGPGSGTAGDDGAGAGSAGSGAGDGSGNSSGDAFAPASAALRRLTAPQYQSSVRSLLGPVELTVVLEPDTVLNGFVAIASARATISPAAMEKYEAAAFEAAAQALAASRREAFVGCTPAGMTDAACTREFIERFGRRAFRRPLDAAEIARYAEVADTAATTLNDFYAGIEFAVAGMLQSPNFLFRVEVGEADPADPGRLRYSSYEMASRLSFLFWNTMPDDDLLDAAEAGELVTTGGLAAQVDRLIDDPRTRAAMNNFHAERLGIEALDTLAKDDELFPAMSAGLGGAMREDILRTLDYLTFETDADYRDVFETRVAFVDAELAELYGVDAPASGVARAELPADGLRMGLLGKAGLLAQNAHVRNTSPTLRGKFVRERVLCQSIPAPPNDVSTTVPEPDPDAPTMRDRLELHRSVPRCAGCHALMDPIGLAFENFDAIGAYRETDNGHELDTSGDIDGATFADPKELAALLTGLPSASECLVRQLYRYAVAHVETSGELPVIQALSQSFADAGHSFPQLLRAVVQSDGFRYAATQEAP
jgi:hypothetical protein